MIGNSNVNPVCCACGDLIGEMPLDIYVKAIKHRGEYLFCPGCRKYKCDCCGWFLPAREVTPCLTENGDFAGNACEACIEFVLFITYDREDFPHFRTLKKPNLSVLTFHGNAPAINYDREDWWNVV